MLLFVLLLFVLFLFVFRGFLIPFFFLGGVFVLSSLEVRPLLFRLLLILCKRFISLFFAIYNISNILIGACARVPTSPRRTPKNLKVFVPLNPQLQRSKYRCASIQMQSRSPRRPQDTIVGRGLATLNLYNR